MIKVLNFRLETFEHCSLIPDAVNGIIQGGFDDVNTDGQTSGQNDKQQRQNE